MTRAPKKLFLGILVFWLLVIGGFIAMKEWTLRTGTEVLLSMRPVDPRDLFRGDYVILSYEISRLDAPFLLENGEVRTVYVPLTLDDAGIARASAPMLTKPPEGLFITGSAQSFGSRLSIEYGIESFFVPEGRGREIEWNLRQMQAKVAIDADGRAVLKGLVRDGQDVTF